MLQYFIEFLTFACGFRWFWNITVSCNSMGMNMGTLSRTLKRTTFVLYHVSYTISRHIKSKVHFLTRTFHSAHRLPSGTQLLFPFVFNNILKAFKNLQFNTLLVRFAICYTKDMTNEDVHLMTPRASNLLLMRDVKQNDYHKLGSSEIQWLLAAVTTCKVLSFEILS